MSLNAKFALSALAAALILNIPVAAQESAKPTAAPAPEAEASTAEPGKKKRYNAMAIKHYNRGVELHQTGFLNQAVEEYKAAIESDPTLLEAYTNLGLIYSFQRSYAKAIEAFNKALELKSKDTTALNGLATVLYARGRVDEAMAKWKEAIDINPRFASAYCNMGTALENEKDYSKALGCFVKALRINPKMADAYYSIGNIYYKDKHPAQAYLFLSKAIVLSPEAEFVREAKHQISTIDGQLGKDEPAISPDLRMNLIPPQEQQQNQQNQQN
ncbi:MAG: tetratricopeptide repeat protein [Candidatus Obscuribacterales bacterium]|nr:tetratricopeptide repeat protein [Candidatus Obscuribacterales bacterium]